MAIDPKNPLLNGPRRIDARPVLRLEPPAPAELPAGPAPVSEADILAARTPAGAWSRQTLAGWGVAWPPPKGWKERLIKGLPQEPASVRVVESLPPPLLTPVAPAGRVPGPNDPGFDSTKHGLLAPPRVTYRRCPE